MKRRSSSQLCGDDHALVRIGHAAVVPGGQLARCLGAAIGEFTCYRSSSCPRKHHALHQRIRWPDGSRRASPVQAVSPTAYRPCTSVRAVQVGDHAAAGVVRSRHHGNGLLGHVDAQLQAAGVDVGEVLLDETQRLVRDVQVDAVEATLSSSRSRWRGPPHRAVPARRAGRALGIKRVPPVAGSSRRPPSPRTASVIRKLLACGWYRQVGWNWMNSMLLHPAARAPGGGDAVARGRVGVGGVQVDLARAAGGQDGVRAPGKVSTSSVSSSSATGPRSALRAQPWPSFWW